MMFELEMRVYILELIGNKILEYISSNLVRISLHVINIYKKPNKKKAIPPPIPPIPSQAHKKIENIKIVSRLLILGNLKFQNLLFFPM